MHIKIYTERLPETLNAEMDVLYERYILNDAAYNWITDWETPDQIYVAYEGDSWLSVVELFNRSILVGERELQVAGISGVLTHPDHRGQGYARMLIENALKDARKMWGVSFALLTCKPGLVPYYEASGWNALDSIIYFKQGEGIIAFDPQKVSGMIYAFEEHPFPSGAINMQALPW